MKSLLKFLLLMLVASNVFAQDFQKIELLIKKINATPSSEEKITLFTSLGIEYTAFYREHEKCLGIYQKGIDLAKKLNEKDHEANLYYLSGVLKEHLRYFDEALTFYNKAIDIYIAENNYPRLVRLTGKKGDVFAKKLNYDLAIASYEKALKLANQHKVDDHYIMQLYASIGDCYAAVGDVSKAQKQYNKMNQI